ncbi:unnamed protein product [Pleuronectes platessa]|uniref:Uncharacterized protein n=1 Tax=Pleuronectes platessa TaxID=8262 RepID=A0A9N7UPL3_PLEPL|nr:unnamed protein product [Pleuronectes platessa]
MRDTARPLLRPLDSGRSILQEPRMLLMQSCGCGGSTLQSAVSPLVDCKPVNQPGCHAVLEPVQQRSCYRDADLSDLSGPDDTAETQAVRLQLGSMLSGIRTRANSPVRDKKPLRSGNSAAALSSGSR